MDFLKTNEIPQAEDTEISYPQPRPKVDRIAAMPYRLQRTLY